MPTNRVEKNRICKWCNEQFDNIIAPDFANHVRWCEQNPRDEKESREKIKETFRNTISQRKGELKEYELICEVCTNKFIHKSFENEYRHKKFCSQKCANSYSRSFQKSIKGKTKNIACTLCGEKQNAPIVCCLSKFKCDKCRGLIKPCLNCELIFKANRKFCSHDCASSYRRKQRSKNIKVSYNAYRRLCSFIFQLKKYPLEFDFSLIEKYGWYHASTSKHPNLDGVSRDHMYSVKEGFKNRIDPYYISHPANCRLVTQRNNSSKCTKCCITIESLKEKISEWNIKYDYPTLQQWYGDVNYVSIIEN